MRIVFLDMDGVLNSVAFFDSNPKLDPDTATVPDGGSDQWWTRMVNPEQVKLLNVILAETGAKVVLSSSWRYHVDPEWMQRILEAQGFVGEVIARTPRQKDSGETIMVAQTRGHEIERWMVENKHLEIESFVILDDMGPGAFAHMAPYLVRTSWANGLQEHHIKAAIDMLQNAG
jgi:hypothetical protein